MGFLLYGAATLVLLVGTGLRHRCKNCSDSSAYGLLLVVPRLVLGLRIALITRWWHGLLQPLTQIVVFDVGCVLVRRHLGRLLARSLRKRQLEANDVTFSTAIVILKVVSSFHDCMQPLGIAVTTVALRGSHVFQSLDRAPGSSTLSSSSAVRATVAASWYAAASSGAMRTQTALQAQAVAIVAASSSLTCELEPRTRLITMFYSRPYDDVSKKLHVL